MLTALILRESGEVYESIEKCFQAIF